MPTPLLSKPSPDLEEAQANQLPYLAPGFGRTTESDLAGNPLQTFLSGRYPKKAPLLTSLPPPATHKEPFPQRFAIKSHAPYYNLAFRKSRPPKMEDFCHPLKLAQRCLNTLLNLFIFIFAGPQARFNRELLRHLNRK